MVAAAIGSVVGLAFLAAGSARVAIAETVTSHAQSQHIAEDGIELIREGLDRDSLWRTRPVGVNWISGLALADGELTCRVERQEAVATPLLIGTPSFECGDQKLSNGVLGLVAPQLSGWIADWWLERRGLLGSLTSATLPTIGTKSTPYATDGMHGGYVIFVAGVAAEACFVQTLSEPWQPYTRYRVSVNVSDGGLASLLPEFAVELMAGSDLVVSTQDSSCLSLLQLSASTQQHTLTYETGSNPPTGPISLRLRAKTTLGVATAAVIDEVAIESSQIMPLIVTSTGRYDGTTAIVVAEISPPLDSGESARVVHWFEP